MAAANRSNRDAGTEETMNRTCGSPLLVHLRAALALYAMSVVSVIILCAVPAQAQFDSAQVSGVIQDATGGVLPGVDVTLISAGTGLERSAVTNEGGLYTFPNVTVGEYRIKAALTGFNSVTKTAVTLTAAVNIHVD